MDENDVPFIPGISAAQAAPATSATTAPAPAAPFTPVTLTKEKMDRLNQMFYDRSGGSSPVIAQALSAELGLDYEGLRSGTAPLFDQFPSFQGLEPAQRRLSDDQIIQLLAQDENGETIEPGTFFGGMAREFLPQTVGFGGAYAGAKAGYKLQQPIPPANPGLVAAKFTIPLVTSTLGFFGAYGGGREVTDYLLGEEKPMLPGTTNAYEAGKTAMGAMAWMPMPFLISKNVSFGGAQLLDNIAKIKATRAEMGPPTITQAIEIQKVQNQLGSGAEKILSREKGPRSTRLVAAIERLLSGTAKQAKESPKFVATIEGLAGAGQTAMGYQAESVAPGDMSTRLGFELTGAMTPAILGTALAAKIPGFLTLLKGVTKKGGLKETMAPLLQRRQNKAVARILEVLESSGENVDEIIERLSDPTILLDDAGNPIQLTAGAKAGSPTLLAIEASLDQLAGGDLAKARASGSAKAIDAYRTMIYGLISTGDQDALQVAAQMTEELFQQGLIQRIDDATNNLLAATARVEGEGPAMNNMELSEKLFGLIETQLRQGRDKEKRLWSEVPDMALNEFVDASGETTNVPNFITAFENLMPETQEARGVLLRKLYPLMQFVDRKSNEMGIVIPRLADAADGADGVVAEEFAELGTDKTKKFSSALSAYGGGDDPGGFRVFQRKGDPSKGEGKGFITTVVDAKGNKVELQLDPDDRIVPYSANIIDGTGASALRVGARDSIIPLAGPSKLDEAVAIVRRRMSADGDFKFNPRAEAETAAKEVPEGMEGSTGIFRSGTDGEVTVKELREMRSLALSLAREMRSTGDLNGSRIAYGVADALLDDLNSLGNTNNVAYNTARAYSRALNDTFTRAFAGDIMDTTKKGAERVPPELLAQKLFQGGNDPTYLRVEQIRNVGKFGIDNEFENAAELAQSIDGTTEMLLRNARAAAFDPTTGEINLRMLDKWRRDNAPILEVFPALDADLQNARTAQVLLNEERIAAKVANDDLRGMVTFKNLLPGTTENPTSAVTMALSNGNKTPWKSMNNLLQVAKDAPESQRELALKGLKGSVLEWAMTKAGGTSRTFKPSVAFEALFLPLPNARVGGNLMDWLVSNNAIPADQAKNVKTYLTEMMRFEMAQANGTIDELIDTAGPVLDFYLRVTGSNLGAKASGIMGGGGGDLIARSAGSKVLRQAFEEVPEALKTDVMAKMMQDPVFLAQMMRRGVDEKEKMNIARGIKDSLVKFGFNPIRRTIPAVPRETLRETPEEQPAEPQASVQQPQQNLMAQRFSRPTPTVIQPASAPSPSPVVPPVAAVPQPETRARYAAFFPNESTSQLIRSQQGIGSLMG